MKSKKRWFVTALTACLTLSLGICAEALEYDFDGVEDTEYYPSTSYESLYGAKYNYGGSNATDYQWPALPYGVSSNTSVGCMEKVRFPGLVGSIGGSGIESNITNPIQQEPQIPSTSYQPSAYTSVDGMERKDGSIGTLKIPSLNINMKVWEGETNTSMAKGLGHYSSTSGWDGNIGVCGHRKCYRKTRRMKQSFGLYFFPGKGVRVMACKYLDFQDRKKIAKMYQEEARVLDIAYKIGCHPATIYEELRRGDTGKLDKNQRPEYDPRLAQRTFQEAIRRRGNRRTTTTAESGQ